jgi:flavin-binding protein dodecin
MAIADTASSVYSVTEIIGTSANSWEDAAKNAVETAAKSLRDLRIAEVCKLDMRLDAGKVVEYRARVTLSFKYEAWRCAERQLTFTVLAPRRRFCDTRAASDADSYLHEWLSTQASAQSMRRFPLPLPC